ncbi:alg9-like mannosyltransferase family isoform X2 [Wolffia australiana]
MATRRRSSAVSDRGDRPEEQIDDGSSYNDRNERFGGLDCWLFASQRRLWFLCLLFRIVNSLLVQTYFNPDEHWQALEVAHRVAFGYGHLTWEWKEGIRSYLHPMVFLLLYKILYFLHLDDVPWVMIKSPRLLQSFFASFGDLYVYKLSYLLFNKSVAQWTLFCQLTCWFMFFCIPRTLSNSLETVLTVVSVFYWSCNDSSSGTACSSSRKLALFISAVTCIIRPTSAITWIYLGIWEFVMAKDRFRFFLFEVIPIGALGLAIGCAIDWLMYGSLVLVPLNFLKFNLLSSGGDYYGTHKWHWYFSQGFPAMLFTFLPFSLMGVIQSKKWKLSGLILWVLGVYSILGHKEFRFVLPVLPLALVFSGYFLATAPAPSCHLRKQRKSSSFYQLCPSRKTLVLFLIATNVPMALYMSLVHQRGSEDVMNFLAHEARDGKAKAILFLTPCHATPYYSTLHRNVTMQFLDCSPNFEGAMDESDRFMNNPNAFMSEKAKNWSLPSHIVFFESEEKQLKDFLLSYSYSEVKRFFHAHFKVDRNLQASIVVYSLDEEKPKSR